MKSFLMLLVASFVTGSAYGADECWNINSENVQVRNLVYNLDESNRHIDLQMPISTSEGNLPAGEYPVTLISSAEFYILTAEVNLLGAKDSVLVPATLKLHVPRDPASVVGLRIEARELNAENLLKTHFSEYFYCKMIADSQD